MKNLAGHPEATDIARQELLTAGIQPIPCERKGETKCGVAGRLGTVFFHRAWCYWVVKGYMPFDLAERLAAMPLVGEGTHYSGFDRTMNDVCRVSGHAGGLPPIEGRTRLDVEGRIIVVDEDGSQRAEYDKFAERHESMKAARNRYVFLNSEEAAAAATDCAFVGSYHIDTPEGLAAFAEIVRGVDDTPASYRKFVIAGGE